MTEVYAKHEPYWETGHLARVVSEMETQGSPTIRVIQRDGKYYALEGSHRLAAAHFLGVEPKLVEEITDIDGTTEEFWDRISAGLPCYSFGRVRLLRLADF